MPNNGFSEYKIAILNDIERINGTLDKINNSLMQIALDVESLKTAAKTRSILFGSISGAVISLVVLVLGRFIMGLK